jgi:hypothetical protein
VVGAPSHDPGAAVHEADPTAREPVSESVGGERFTGVAAETARTAAEPSAGEVPMASRITAAHARALTYPLSFGGAPHTRPPVLTIRQGQTLSIPAPNPARLIRLLMTISSGEDRTEVPEGLKIVL